MNKDKKSLVIGSLVGILTYSIFITIIIAAI